MALTTLINIGFPITLTEDISYAMPKRRTLGYCDPDAVLEASDDVAFTNPTVIDVGTSGEFETAAAFIRATADDVPIVLRSY